MISGSRTINEGVARGADADEAIGRVCVHLTSTGRVLTAARQGATLDSAMLQVRDLHVHYFTSRGAVRAVNGVTFDIRRGERFGLVGESGSGKSTIALALLRLIRQPGRIVSGEMVLEGTDLLSLSIEDMREARLAKIALVAQGAMNSLNPVARVKDQIRDGLRD